MLKSTIGRQCVAWAAVRRLAGKTSPTRRGLAVRAPCSPACSIGPVEGREPPRAFLEELGAAFQRLRPQGSHRWNFGGAFRQLETVVRRGVRLSEPDAPPLANGSGGRRDQALAQLDQAVGRLFGNRVEDSVRRSLRDVVGPALEDVHEALGATTEAFRFLSARVEALEAAAARRTAPVEGLAWLVPPPDLAPWTDAIVGWMAGVTGEVLVGECGDGGLPGALARAGCRVRAAEPRGAVALAASESGVDVHLGPIAELLASRPPGELGGLVLAGVVDRSPIEDVVDLLALATDRLAAGATLVVVGSAPSAWGPVALDLLPGRPLHPATWSLLLSRRGYRDLETVAADPPLAYAVRAIR